MKKITVYLVIYSKESGMHERQFLSEAEANDFSIHVSGSVVPVSLPDARLPFKSKKVRQYNWQPEHIDYSFKQTKHF
jgi:hypothetical protein